MLLAVVGSTNITERQEELARMLIKCLYRELDPTLVISGGANGIDSIAEDIAKNLFFPIPVRVHLPTIRQWKPNGFMERNLKIAKDCTHLLCIRTSQSTTYGSGWTADRAEEMGKTVWRITI